MKICILYSGGLDSIIMHHWAKINYPEAEILLNYYDLGQDYNFKELAVLPSEVKIRTLDWLEGTYFSKENTQNIMIPGRNLALATLVACQELPDKIWMGALKGEIHEEATDKNFQFKELINKTLGYVLSPYNKRPEVEFPLAEAGFGKFEATEWYLNNQGDIPTLINSSSCLSAESTSNCDNCGLCIVCLRRWGIFSQLGLTECYIHHPIEEMTVDNKAMIKEMLKGEEGLPCHYDHFRRREIIPALTHYLTGVNRSIWDFV
jgi:7-cyano-7-deazaguanine synthase in queuosine biosynthesis